MKKNSHKKRKIHPHMKIFPRKTKTKSISQERKEKNNNILILDFIQF